MANPSWPSQQPALKPWVASRLREKVTNRVLRNNRITTNNAAQVVDTFSRSPDSFVDDAVQRIMTQVNDAVLRAHDRLDPAELQEEDEAVAAFHTLIEEVQNSLPQDQRDAFLADFLSLDERQERNRLLADISSQEYIDDWIHEEIRRLTTQDGQLRDELNRRNTMSVRTEVEEVIDRLVIAIDELPIPDELVEWFNIALPAPNEDNAHIYEYIHALENKEILLGLKLTLRTWTELGNVLPEGTPSTLQEMITAEHEVFLKERETMSGDLSETTQAISDQQVLSRQSERRLEALRDQVGYIDQWAEQPRQQYVEALRDAFLERVTQDSQAMGVIQAYTAAEMNLFTMAQEEVASVDGMKRRIQLINGTLHQMDTNILAKRFGKMMSGWVVLWWWFQTFRGLLNLLPRHADALPQFIQDMLLNADGSPNHDAMKLASAIVGILVWLGAHGYIHQVEENIKQRKRNHISWRPNVKDIFWRGISLPKKLMSGVVVLMIIMDMTGHMATFMWSDKKNIEGKRIDLAKDDFFKVLDEVNLYLSSVPEESIKNTEALLETEDKEFGGKWPLWTAKHTATLWVPSDVSPALLERGEEIVTDAWGSEWELVTSQQELEQDLQDLSETQFIIFNNEKVEWVQIPRKVLGLWSGITDLETNMEIQEIVSKLENSVQAYAEQIQTIAEKYNISIDELEAVLKKMESTTYADRAPLQFEAVDQEKLRSKIDALMLAATGFTAELKKVDPNFDMFDIPATMKFFKEANFNFLELTHRGFLIIGLSFLSVWFMLIKFLSLRASMRRRSKDLARLDSSFLEARSELEAAVKMIQPYMTHSWLGDHLTWLFSQIGISINWSDNMQEQLLATMEGRNSDAVASTIVRDMFGITVHRDKWWSEMTSDEQNACSTWKRKFLRRQEKIERAYQDWRIRNVLEWQPWILWLKWLVRQHKAQIDQELGAFVNPVEVSFEPYSNWFLRHEWHTEGTIISCVVELLKFSPTFRKAFLERYNTKEWITITPIVAAPTQQAPVLPDPFAPQPPPQARQKTWRNGRWLLWSGNV